MGQVFLPVFGAVLTLVAFCLGFATYVLPYWFEHYKIEHNEKAELVHGDKMSMMGFWAYCDARSNSSGNHELSNCQWFFWDNFSIEKTFPDWIRACQGVYGFALMFEFFMLVIMNLRPLCCPNSRLINITIGFTMLVIVFIGKVAVVIVFGNSSKLEGGYPKQFDIPNTSYKMGWCPYVSIVGAAMSLLASSAYFAIGCKGNRKTADYEYQQDD